MNTERFSHSSAAVCAEGGSIYARDGMRAVSFSAVTVRSVMRAVAFSAFAGVSLCLAAVCGAQDNSTVNQENVSQEGIRFDEAGLPAAGEGCLVKMVEIPAGEFLMGSTDAEADYDEAPVHRVSISRPFRMGETEVTNAQYELFDPSHREMRGKDGLSVEDDEAVVNVSWGDAVEFCRWLSAREGRSYRLPTEAEWEYACRAGAQTAFFTGDTLPEPMWRNQRTVRNLVKVPLNVGRTPANAFGLRDMHGNVEEWCMDWYGPYDAEDQVDPTGPAAGDFRVTRGGSHNTPTRYLRSANRMGMIPEDRHSQTGFRVVEGDVPIDIWLSSAAGGTAVEGVGADASAGKGESADRTMTAGCGDGSIGLAGTGTSGLDKAGEQGETMRQDSGDGGSGSGGLADAVRQAWGKCAEEAFFIPPVPFVSEPTDGATPFFPHNHQPSVTWCDNGDLLAAWFSTIEESGREMVVLSSRLRRGETEWESPKLFFKVPDRNMTGTALFNDGRGTLYHINGVEASGYWQNLIMVLRTSTDDGHTWSAPRIIAPEHTRRHQVISGTVKVSDDVFIQVCDAGPGGNDGAAVHITTDHGLTWTDPWDGAPLPEIGEGVVGTTIAGIHAGVAVLEDGSLMALGRGIASSVNSGDGKRHMPMSLSRDMGATWEYHASEFPPIDSGQRLVLMRLQEGPLLLVSFTDHPEHTPEADRGMIFSKDPDGTDGTETAGTDEISADGVVIQGCDAAGKKTGADGGQETGTAVEGDSEESVDGDRSARNEAAACGGEGSFRGYGMFAALSYDDGRTWPVRKLMTDGVERDLRGGAWTGDFVMDATHAEPKGYLCGTQSPDGTIHILSSRLHYRFNLAWLEQR